ncbi:hypothetical protein GCM10009706_14520 [Curtobacterium citreum]|uniref:Uncharacterized protein n=1 Tax=Curtobacterium citreum TaxID=2036 RepID=A0ABT2HDI0_9MICO|nr:hypothetical protein [Curtobacterium citreum]MCS6521321.1 hypothetical protein [Curtobacterium citreum]TQJ28179.1 hypothetical protein FB462_2059 [Curtobacterium citreum]GGL77150.1 hypothetical protein GCM10009706_14520 [Curtobacterium citreum]
MATATFKSAVTYGAQTIDLRDNSDTDKVEDEILEACRVGGGWVSLPTAAGSRVIFVTAGVPIDIRNWTYTPADDQVFAQ